MRQSIGFSSSSRPNTLTSPAIAVSTTAPTLWTMLSVRSRSRSSPIAIASATQTCSATSSQAGGAAIDVAAVDEVADFHERQQHGEQDRGGLHHAQRRVVAAAAQEDARAPRTTAPACRSPTAAS